MESSTILKLIRCLHCNRKLASGSFAELVIICPRCGTRNHLRALSPSHADERLRAPGSGSTRNDVPVRDSSSGTDAPVVSNPDSQ
ncbi:Com family DNA-binding transcriptional regulator [Burkholderia pseudomallei]|uniref:Com family DNA-binding transcriptional regulator n=1 Tax=Burkholderia pseudomallei TaxID=28450 RepID=UPI0009B23F19|nr:Com family DNA-binding transcriptional regulator [Burkholderia pseudomallei]